MRYLSGVTGSDLTAGALGANAKRTTATAHELRDQGQRSADDIAGQPADGLPQLDHQPDYLQRV